MWGALTDGGRQVGTVVLEDKLQIGKQIIMITPQLSNTTLHT